MIVTVTMNPALDRTLYLKKFTYAGLNRVDKSVTDCGGKGINVSRMIKNLGGESLAAGFLGGHTGELLNQLLLKEEIETNFLFIGENTRINTKIMAADGALTELNEPGPYIAASSLEELIKKLKDLASPDSLFVLAGSIPPGIGTDIYKVLITKLKGKGARVFLDADGRLFSNGIEARPDIIKPNQYELMQFFGLEKIEDEKQILRMAKRIQQMGIPTIIVSMGSNGSLFVFPEDAIRVPGLPAGVQSTVGAGDAMVGAFAYGISQGFDKEACVRLSAAASMGAVETEGTKMPQKTAVEMWMGRIRMEYCR